MTAVAEGAPAGARPAPPTATAADRGGLARLVLVVAAVIAVGYLAGVGETVLLVGALLLCIVAHEWGHYATARAAGMQVTEFFVGFGPRLWSIRRGETEYGVKALPLGGYCKITGMSNLEEVDPAVEARTYRRAPVWRRLTVGVAGSAMHFLIALVVLFAMFAGTGDRGFYLTPPLPAPTAPIAAVDGLTTGASPAMTAGFRIGDRIEAIDGRTFATWDQLTAYIRSHPGRPLDVTVARGGRPVHLHPVPADLSKVHPAGVDVPVATKPTGFLGIEPALPTAHPGLAASIGDAGGAWVHVAATTLGGLGRLVSAHGIQSYLHMLHSQQAADSTSPSSVRLASPVKVVQLLHQASQTGLGSVLWLLAVVNLSIGIFNLIPLLPLDGGHVAIACYEGIRSRISGRRYVADVAKLAPVLYLALAAIAFLGVTALFLDLRDLTG